LLLRDSVDLLFNESHPIMRTLRLRAVLVAAAALGAAACESDMTEPPIPAGAAEISVDITSNRRLYAETTYTIKGFVHVTNGATLTIDAGTVIKGDYNTLGSSLFIMRGAKIMAVGTATEPIVFTSSQPVGSRSPGDWGGLVILGNGVVNRAGQIKLEGTGTATGSVTGTNYPINYTGDHTGSNIDNSGELKYVRVEYAGYAPTVNEELNSFTFAAVGNQTKLSYLQSMAGLDDAFEWFGGAVDADHLVAYEAGDDAFDMSEGFSGRLQYVIAFNSTVLTQRVNAGLPATDPQGIENDGCGATTGCTAGQASTPFNIPVVANFTLVGTGSTTSSGSSGGIGMMLRRGTGGYYVNGVIARFPRFGISVRDAETYNRAGATATPNLATADLAVKNVLLVETAAPFDNTTANVQNSFDLAGNAIVNNTTATTASLFTAFPTTAPSTTTTAAAFDWTPSATSAALTGGMTTFSGKLATATTTPLASGSGAVAGTTYVGAAAPGGTKWWAGWTVYAQK
jgi:hypothetical protein